MMICAMLQWARPKATDDVDKSSEAMAGRLSTALKFYHVPGLRQPASAGDPGVIRKSNELRIELELRN